MTKVILFLNLIFVSSLTLAHQILVIGDSHAFGNMGNELQAELKSQGQQVEKFAVVGSSAKNWLKPQNDMPSFTELVDKIKPDQVIVSLGTNDIFNTCTNKNFSSENIEKFLAIIPKSTNCIWVGPPGYLFGRIINKCGKNFDKFVIQLKSGVTKRCQFIDTREAIELMSNKENIEKDTVHVNSLGGKIWSKFILGKIKLTQ